MTIVLCQSRRTLTLEQVGDDDHTLSKQGMDYKGDDDHILSKQENTDRAGG